MVFVEKQGEQARSLTPGFDTLVFAGRDRSGNDASWLAAVRRDKLHALDWAQGPLFDDLELFASEIRHQPTGRVGRDGIDADEIGRLRLSPDHGEADHRRHEDRYQRPPHRVTSTA